MSKKFGIICLTFICTLALLLSACGNDDNAGESTNGIELGQKELTIPYVSWASTVAGVNVIKAVLEDIGYDIELTQVTPGALFAGIADGSADMSVGAVTLPYTHESYWKKYGDQIDDIGITMKDSVTIGLAVPSYMKIDSLEDLTNNTNNIGKKLEKTIVGIDPGAGQMQLTKNKVMPGYNLDKWTLQATSAPAMTGALAGAIDDQKPIVVTLWEPHWAFIEWDLKYLKDPKNLFGEPDSLHAVARKGLKEDAPAAYKVLDQFHWTKQDMGKVMVKVHDGMEPIEAAEEWIENNQEKVKKWKKGLKTSK
ncbi:glycine betaine ABC transporter substrate-binding protein [Virgibacillus ihumii]|uniref:glycine betaine ABC transporter substrate-binding protein n=1 Tax=Virgibacillus ihumii TaxID=2686091 RepID=UPI00157E056D|nr:glycine betaine ABC transporter substrate-binding protein [Virgibacillus ihumii]